MNSMLDISYMLGKKVELTLEYFSGGLRERKLERTEKVQGTVIGGYMQDWKNYTELRLLVSCDDRVHDVKPRSIKLLE